jgi:hypothetical protein
MFCPAPPHPFLQGSPTNFETQPYYTNALHKCNTIILLNKALLQGMHPQLMQLLNLKHCFTTTNALYKCNAIVLLTLLQGMYPQLMQLLNSKHHRTTTNALYKCNTIVLLNKALLQSMHPSQQGPSAGHASTAAAACSLIAANRSIHSSGKSVLQSGQHLIITLFCFIIHFQ